MAKAKKGREPAQDRLNQLIAFYNAKHYLQVESSAQVLVKQYPESGSVWKILGVTLLTQGKDALLALQKAAQLLPDDAASHFNLGNALKALGQLEEAVASYRRALKIKSDYAEAYCNMGAALRDSARFEEAVASYRQALAINPVYPRVYSNLGLALNDLGKFEEAAESSRRAIEIKPDYAEAHNNLGLAFKGMGKLADAEASFRTALALKPDFAEAHNNLGLILGEFGQYEAAAQSFRRTLEINPDFVKAYCNLGYAQLVLGQLEDAVASLNRALEINPDYVEAHNNLGYLQRELGQFEDAAKSFRRALQINPEYIDGFNNLLFSLNYTATGKSAESLDYARQFGRVSAGKVRARYTAWLSIVNPYRLRVGLVSGDMRDHVAGYFLEGLLAHIDPAHIELFAYSTSHKEDEITARLRPYFSEWKSLLGKSDEAAAQLIHSDGVHVLLDLSGHTAHNRLPVFAWKPAPVQASWLGYFATTGVAEMDYVLVDEVGVPEAQRDQFTEAVWYLPDTRLCFTPPKVDIPVAPLPALSNGYITFGCFQNLPKVSDEVLAVCGEIFAALPKTRLRLQCKQLGEPAQVEKMLSRLARYGVGSERVNIHGAVSREDYLSAHAEVDMILDTFPYPGGTTTCEALWMGVPTLTLAGDRLLSRQGASLLAAAGLPDWVAANRSEYISKAIAFAGDLPKLSALRAVLRQQALASPVFDAKRFARNLEEALWGMWKNIRIDNKVRYNPEDFWSI